MGTMFFKKMISLILILLFQLNFILCCKQLNDCFESKGRGQCAFDGTSCACNPGFRGRSCSVQPWHVKPGTILPGFVQLGEYSYYRLEPTDYTVGDQVLVDIKDGGDVSVFASIGEVPTDRRDGNLTFQYFALPAEDKPQLKIISISSLATKNEENEELGLFVSVRGDVLEEGKSGIQYEIFHLSEFQQNSRILGVIDNWATYVIIVFVLIMCCACAGLGGVCWIAAGGEVEEDEGSALQEAEKRRRQDEKAEKILQAYNDGYGQYDEGVPLQQNNYNQQQQQQPYQNGGGSYNSNGYNNNNGYHDGGAGAGGS